MFLLLPAAVLGTSVASADTWDASRRDQAKRLWLTKCTKCHRLYDPKDYEDEEWKDLMEKMRNKAHLNDEQYGQISRYLDELRKEA